MVQELYHMLLERDSTCQRTCFRIYYEGKPLAHFTEMRNVPNIKSRAVFTVVEEPYNLREARIHVRHLREMLRCLDRVDALVGMDCQSVTCFPAITAAVAGHDGESVLQRRGGGRPTGSGQPTGSQPDAREGESILPPSYLLPTAKEELPIKQMIPASLANDAKQQLRALKSISFSSFNPPPGPRKIKGDVLYLVVETVEDRRFHITCCTRGFFVNCTTQQQGGGASEGAAGGVFNEKFNPEPASQYSRGGGHSTHIFHSLFDLLSELSPHFRKTLAQILKAKAEKSL